jgi:hypothetical protein
MAPKKKAPTFRQCALMISSWGELSTQALEDVDKARAETRHCIVVGIASSSATTGSSSAGAAAISVTASSAPEDVQPGADIVDLTEDVAAVTTPTALLKKLQRK